MCRDTLGHLTFWGQGMHKELETKKYLELRLRSAYHVVFSRETSWVEHEANNSSPSNDAV